jgi:hypothetical protein
MTFEKPDLLQECNEKTSSKGVVRRRTARRFSKCRSNVVPQVAVQEISVRLVVSPPVPTTQPCAIPVSRQVRNSCRRRRWRARSPPSGMGRCPPKMPRPVSSANRDRFNVGRDGFEFQCLAWLPKPLLRCLFTKGIHATLLRHRHVVWRTEDCLQIRYRIFWKRISKSKAMAANIPTSRTILIVEEVQETRDLQRTPKT